MDTASTVGRKRVRSNESKDKIPLRPSRAHLVRGGIEKCMDEVHDRRHFTNLEVIELVKA